jgi:two-component system nitrate/nitrite response regulator NarL
VQAVALLQEQAPRAKVVMLTVSDSEDFLFDALRNGADGYLLKDLRPDQLYDMLRAVMRDESPISPAIAGRLLKELRGHDVVRNPAPERAEGPSLTRREIEILQLVADGLSNKEIGTHLSITEGTVKNHVHNALEKLHLENRIQAAAYVVRQGMGHRPEAV